MVIKASQTRIYRLLQALEPIIIKLKRNSQMPDTVLKENCWRSRVPNFISVRYILCSINWFIGSKVSKN